MRLLVDCIPYDGGRSGISVYVREVVSALAGGHDLTLLVEPGSPLPAVHRGMPVWTAPAWTARPALSMLWHLFCLPWLLRRERDSFDGFVLAAASRRVCAFYPLPSVATVHDLANFRIPGKYSPLRMLYLAHLLPHFAKKADRLVAVSAATARDMETYWKVPHGSVTVLHNGCCALRPTRADRPSWLAAQGLEKGRYILYVSRLEHPAKNHVRLIEAFERLGREDLLLVLAGSGWHGADAIRMRAALSPAAGRIRFTGFLEADDLAEAYAGAAMYVFPSRFEGFGLSLVEAMAAGVPCACSDNGALGEIASDVAETFSPDDTGGMARAMATLLDEPPEARAGRIARGKAHAATFTWKAHAQGLAKLLADARNGRASP
ncbi:MAG: glycosyltransferase family 4 protein [Kiritimatiellae bacterium]|nr:glycosyltransferase family 4 protein [Kiritimatiellia bacterium]